MKMTLVRSMVLLAVLAGLSACGSGEVAIEKQIVPGTNTVRLVVSSTTIQSVAEVQVNDGAPECGVSGRLPARVSPGESLSFDVGYACSDVLSVRARVGGKWHEQKFAPSQSEPSA